LNNAKKLRPTTEFGVNLAGYFTGQFGVGTSARAFAEALEQASVPLVLNNQTAPSHVQRAFLPNDAFCNDNPYRINIIHINADEAKYFFSTVGPEYSHNRFNIGIWYWELSNFPEKWQDRFQYYQELWVLSRFTAESLSKASPIPIVKVRYPLPAPTHTILPREARRRYGIRDEQFVFLFVFDFHSSIERKNPHGLLRAFSDAFKGQNDVLLLINGINGHAHSDELSMLRNKSKGLNVRILEEHLSRPDYHALFSAANCYASLHRSEGFGVPIAEAMLLGKPVIATGYSGNMDYMNLNNSLPIKFKMIQLNESHGPYEKGNVWADPDIEHASGLMRWVYENRDEADRIGGRAQIEIRETLNPTLAGREMKERLKLISSKI